MARVREELLQWDSQPQEAAGVDWDNPITRGLSFLWSAPTSDFEVTRGFYRSGVWTTPSLIVPTSGGLGARNAATASTRFDATKYAASTEYTLVSLFLDDLGRGTTRNFFDSDATSRNFQFRCSAGDKVELIIFNTGGSNTSGFVSTASTDSAKPNLAVGRVYDTGTIKIDFQGQQNTSAIIQPVRTNAIAGSVYSVGSSAGDSNPFPGAVYYAAAFTRALSDAEVASLSANPWQLFAPRSIWVPVSAGGGAATDLTIQEAAHAHGADNLGLTVATGLTVADATHAHSADNLTLTTSGTVSLTIQDAAHAHAVDGPTLTVGYVDLTIADALHGHAADSLTLSVSGATNLVIQDAAHGHTADPPTLTLGYIDLTVADGLHAHTADSLTLSVVEYTDLVIARAMHGHLADNVTLSDSAATVLGSLAGSRPLDPATRSNKQTATR